MYICAEEYFLAFEMLVLMDLSDILFIGAVKFVFQLKQKNSEIVLQVVVEIRKASDIVFKKLYVSQVVKDNYTHAVVKCKLS